MEYALQVMAAKGPLLRLLTRLCLNDQQKSSVQSKADLAGDKALWSLRYTKLLPGWPGGMTVTCSMQSNDASGLYWGGRHTVGHLVYLSVSGVMTRREELPRYS